MGSTQMVSESAGETDIEPQAGADAFEVFGACLRSELPLPELPPCAAAAPRFTVRTVGYGQPEPAGFRTCHEWTGEDGALLCRSARRREDYLLTFPGRAGFHIEPDGVITCRPAAGVADELIRQLLLNQVLPRALSNAGALLLHASAVTLPGGRTVAFLGESGQGKSTLVSYCHRRGARIIDDDCVLFRLEDQPIRILGGVPTLRLYPDSLRALDYDPAAFTPYLEHSAKRQMRLPRDATAGSRPRVLDALFVLAAPDEMPGADAVAIAPATGQRAMMAILGSLFSLDPTDADTMTRTFSQAGRVLDEDRGLRAHLLHYERDYANLERVWQALLDHG